MRQQFTLRSVLILIALVAGVLGGYRAFWSDIGYSYLLAFYLSVISAATALATYARQRTRTVLIGFAITGWSYFAFALRGGLGNDRSWSYIPQLSSGVKLGLLFAILAGLATY